MSYTPPGQGYSGSSYPGAPYPGAPVPTSGLAVGGLVCSLIVCVPVVAPLLGVILGAAALPAIGRGEKKGKGMAIAGIVIGAMVLLLLQPGVGYGFYRAYRVGTELFTGAAVKYATAVGTADMTGATLLSAATWTEADSKKLADDLAMNGKFESAAVRTFQFAPGPNGKAQIVVDVDLTYVGGKKVTLSVQLVPPPPGGQAFQVGSAQVLP